MKILLLTDWTYPCDHQFLSNVYAQNFVDRGHEITWVMRPDNSEQKKIISEIWNGSNVYILPPSAYDPARNTTRFLAGRIQSNTLFEISVEFSEFDLVHVRNDLSMGLVAIHLANEFEIPYVHQITHLKSEEIIGAARSGSENRISWVKGQLGKRLRRYIASSSDLVLPISDAMKDHLENQGYSTPMQTLPTGAEVINEAPNGDSFRNKYDVNREFVLLYMGSMSPYRELEFLFDMLQPVIKKYDTELVMAGGRSESNRERLKGEAKRRNVSDNVTFTGWISNRSEIQSAVAAADIGLSPFRTDSILRTNAPIKTLEYMSLGTPVVASATPDQRKVIDESGAGVTVEHNTEPFSDAIDMLLSSQETRNKMGKKGREYLRENRNFDTLTNKTESIYEDVVKHRV
ncbi:glycosyltransferase family 4 protein [Halobacterium salinarum]|uniref:glycosyltransferase family 4 protein n=1 Tax=Halobacterium salinarum TaxID=2242 RepID=UPI002552847C|nr:glycosyltransferase family 4 protein [Halobacterium salinarum]MDL0126366.1 glycosyltransferase family 4 protein [Halobacterium salinarum]